MPLLLTALAAALAACGSASATPAASTATGGGSCSHAKVVSDHADGTTVHLCLHQVLVVKLHSTYWSGATTSSKAVLRRTGPTTVKPGAPGACVPGSGCGTSTTRFVGVGRGKARVTAHRTLCGEAIQCGKGQGSFVLVVVVGHR
jgi:hypothetical protein